MLRLGKLREKEMSLGVSIGVVFIMQTWGTQLNFPYERKRAATKAFFFFPLHFTSKYEVVGF